MRRYLIAMLLLWIFLGFVLVMALAFGGALWTAVRWSREWQEWKEVGVEATGTVIEKRQGRSSLKRRTHLRYEYLDQFGQRHRSGRSLVTPEAWGAPEEGDPIQVIYSQKRPRISWPKY